MMREGQQNSTACVLAEGDSGGRAEATYALSYLASAPFFAGPSRAMQGGYPYGNGRQEYPPGGYMPQGSGGMGGPNAVPFTPGMAPPMHPGMGPMGQMGGPPPGYGYNMGGPPQGYGYGGPPQGHMQPGQPYGQPPPHAYGEYGHQPQPQMQQAPAPPPPTDEEQDWLDAQLDKAEASKAPEPEPQDDEEPPTPSDTQPATSEPGDYDDVMKLIEENRRKNEAKRAAQSARNAEIIAAFEQRQAQGS